MDIQLKSQKMRTAPVGRLLASMALPAVLSMLVQALYNIVDSIFVSFYAGEAGVTALSIAFPMQMLVLAFALGIGVGANVQIAKNLGEGKREDANQTVKNALFLAVATALVFVVVGLVASKPFINAFTADAEVRQMGGVYLTIVTAVSFGAFVEISCSKALQATGNMKVPMISQLIGAVTNIILDPIFIFGFKMGVTGAAVATVAGQIVAMCYVITVFLVKKHDVSISMRKFRPQWKYIAGICRIGLPTMVMNAVTSFTTIFMNGMLKNHDPGIAVLGAYFKLQSFVFMPVFGLTQGAMPILSYNYGAGDKKRFEHCFRLSVVVALIIMALGLALFWLAPGLLMKMFNASGAFLTQGKYALRIISLSFVFAAFGIVMTTMFQSVGNGVTSLIMSLLRQVVFLLPIAYLLLRLWALEGVWFCYPLAEVLVFAIFLPIALVTVRRKFRGRDEPRPVAPAGESDMGMPSDFDTPAGETVPGFLPDSDARAEESIGEDDRAAGAEKSETPASF